MLSSAKSMDDEAARLTVLRDPKRMAALLIRAFSTSMMEHSMCGSLARRGSTEEEDEVVEETQEEFQDLERQVAASKAINMLHVADGNRLVIEDEDDAGEEDEDDDDEEKPLEEEELEAAATALQIATRIVEELRFKLVLKASKPMNRQQLDDKESATTLLPQLRADSSFLTQDRGPGVPIPHAQVQSNPSCSGCNKWFIPFHRSKNCASCGFAFCLKCSSKSGLLPTCFGYRDEAVRTCDWCARWFQKALDRYFEALELVAYNKKGSAVGTSSFWNCTSLDPTSSRNNEVLSAMTRPNSCIASPEVVPRTTCNIVADESVDDKDPRISFASSMSSSRRRSRNSSISLASSPPIPKSKPWFSGHLRAMHVSDRLPRKIKVRGEGDGIDFESNSPDLGSQRSRLNSVASTKSRNANEDADDIFGEQHVDSVENKSVERQDGSSLSESLKQEESVLAISVKSIVGSESTTSLRLERNKRRSKFLRSASFDLTHLQSALSPDSSSEVPRLIRRTTFGLDEGQIVVSDIVSNVSGCPSSVRSKKAFDDSDIVDKRARLDSADTHMKSQAKCSAAVLRFAVYEMSGKETAGLRRTFGFAKANPLLDRYTLELDCRQRIVQAKSVFMHRFWSFHCDSVQSFLFGTSDGMASLIVSNGGQGKQSFELKFANDDEREQFKQAIDNCRSLSLQTMRAFATQDHVSLPAQLKAPTSPVLDSLDLPTPKEPNTTFSADLCTTIESDLSITHNIRRSTATDLPVLQSILVPLLPGETVVEDTELQATLLIGPASETYESALVWGRIPGKVAVTNYRVIFIPFNQGLEQPRCGGQGGVAYIPLFNITHVHLLHPNGRRTKAGHTHDAGKTGSASIISIICKDIRVMRFQLDTHPSMSNDHIRSLRATISKLADASQRYTVRECVMGIAGMPNSSNDSDLLSFREGESSDGYPHQEMNLTMPRERSGMFAIAYSISSVSSKLNGWNLFVDEREFQRQIGGDTAVSPFLKYYKNDRGNICKTYPSLLLLPASMNSVTLAKVANSRAKNRLPVITYYHRRNRCVLTRSSQPLLGNLLSGTSNVSDQLLLGVYRRLPDIILNQSQSSQSSRPIYIFDARKPKASTGNRLMGKGGVETPQDYPGAVIHHLNIANMYRMQSSFLGLLKLHLPGSVDDTDRTWLSSVESTKWLDHVRLVLDGALKIARVLELEGASVLVHCSDGWDRTAQLCALAQLMIDPFYRTIRGFAILVEKDWLAFGHKFAERLGSDRNRDPQRNKSSPIMFQFLDAVWQIQRQYPHSFEFNERFLLHLANALTSGLYGTFMYDSRLQRDVNEIKHSTVSVWTPVLMKTALYSNSTYEANDGPIWPWVSCNMIRLWENYFFQWHPKFYKCQWVCNLIYHNPAGSTTSANKHQEVVYIPSNESFTSRDSPLSKLLAPSTVGNKKEDTRNEMPALSLYSEEDAPRITQPASDNYTQNLSMRIVSGLKIGNHQLVQSETTNSQEVG
ncbi:hypothetical protein CCR75_006711 [Bremia lactucae]|uniref:Uncharacterized protein n=1 Tax=Bremia lactucae TaxID=4779 RepID=A0A976FF50_BRELC|nr:hypothetical protein CCR75_006711 [Bremia lactucae]